MSSINWLKNTDQGFTDMSGTGVDLSIGQILNVKNVYVRFENKVPKYIDAGKYQNEQGYEIGYILNLLSSGNQYGLLINRMAYDYSLKPYIDDLNSKGLNLDEVYTKIECQIKVSAANKNYKAFTFTMAPGKPTMPTNGFHQNVADDNQQPVQTNKPQKSMKEVLGDELIEKAQVVAEGMSVSMPELIRIALVEFVDINTKKADDPLDGLAF